MPYLKFSNVKFYTGGSKVGLRIRHNQNYRVWVKDGHAWLGYDEQRLINMLWWITKGRVEPTSSTVVKITEDSNYKLANKIMRKKAMRWWNALTLEDKTKFCSFYYVDRIESSLTGREIEVLYCREIVYENHQPIL